LTFKVKWILCCFKNGESKRQGHKDPASHKQATGLKSERLLTEIRRQ